MELTKVISTRRSIRKYKSDPVPERKLRRLYEALRLAPSGANRQNRFFVFVRDAETRKRIAAEAGHQEFVAEAPVLMVAGCEPGGSFDVAIAVDHMVLAATNLGLGTCWVGWFEREPVKRILGIPAAKEVAILVTIGYSNEEPAARPRKAVEELVMLERYKEASS